MVVRRARAILRSDPSGFDEIAASKRLEIAGGLSLFAGQKEPEIRRAARDGDRAAGHSLGDRFYPRPRMHQAAVVAETLQIGNRNRDGRGRGLLAQQFDAVRQHGQYAEPQRDHAGGSNFITGPIGIEFGTRNRRSEDRSAAVILKRQRGKFGEVHRGRVDHALNRHPLPEVDRRIVGALPRIDFGERKPRLRRKGRGRPGIKPERQPAT
jgi:hypothetical protein